MNPKLKMLVVYTAEARIEVTGEYRSAAIGQTIAGPISLDRSFE